MKKVEEEEMEVEGDGGAEEEGSAGRPEVLARTGRGWWRVV